MNECTNKSKRKKKTMNTEKFEEFISQYPIFEYRILDTKDITIRNAYARSAKKNANVMILLGPVPPQ